MRRVVLGAAAAALVFTIGCGGEPDEEVEVSEMDVAETAQAAAESPDAGMEMAVGSDDHDPIPLTITMPAGGAGPDGIGRVAFPDEFFPYPDSVFQRVDGLRIQYSVGDVPADADGRFRFIIHQYKGNSSPNYDADTLSFGAEAYCAAEDPTAEPVHQGSIARIACAASAPGDDKATPPFRTVCSAIYDYVGTPPKTCEGTYACVKCRGGVRVCSENPQCND